MKIVYIDPQSYSNLALYDYSLISNLKSEVTFYGSYLYDQPLSSQMKFVPIFTYNKKSRWSKGFSYMVSLLKIAMRLINDKPNVVHIQWIKIYRLDYLFLRWMLHRGINVVYTAHNTLPHNDISRRYFNVFKKYYEQVSHIIVHTDSTRKELVESFGILESKISVIPHGLLEDECNNEQVEFFVDVISERCNLNGKIVFSCLGAQSYYKGFDLIERLWIENPVFHSNSNIHLLIAGKASSGVSYHDVEKYSNVSTFNYFLSKEEFEAVIRLSDVILLPYREISQSGVLLTVLSRKKAILVSNAGGLVDPFKCGKVGWIVERSNYENFREVMVSILKDPSDIKKISCDDELWSNIARMFSWEEIGNSTLNLYSRLSENQ